MSPFLRYLVRRLLATVPALWGVATLVFLVLYITPGDPIQAMLGEKIALANVEQLRHSLGLDLPFLVRYGHYMLDLLRGDLGRSLVGNAKVADELISRLPATVELAVIGVLISNSIGLITGIIGAVFRRRLADYVATIFSLLLVSVPAFWFCLLLMIAFSVKLDWLPLTGRIDPTLFFKSKSGFLLFDAAMAQDWEAFRDIAKHLILPALAVNVSGAAVIARMTRGAILEVLHLDFIRTARAKGLSERIVIFRHALRNALIPVVTVAGLQMGSLLGGAVITETIFSWPGLGKLTVQAITNRDFPMVQGAVLLMAMCFVAVNLIVDLLYARLDPRITYV